MFEPVFPGYNGAVRDIHGTVNIGAVQPPQRRDHLPQYNRQWLSELQSKFDELEALGVVKKPEDVGVAVEYVRSIPPSLSKSLAAEAASSQISPLIIIIIIIIISFIVFMWVHNQHSTVLRAGAKAKQLISRRQLSTFKL